MVGIVFICVALGFYIISLLGVLRFRSIFNKIHAAAIGETLVPLLLFVGLMILGASCRLTLKLILMILVLWITSPVASHLIAFMEQSDEDGILIVRDQIHA